MNPAWIATLCMSRSVRCALVICSLFRTQSSQYALPAFASRKSAARFLCRMLLPNGVGICGSYHDETTITLGLRAHLVAQRRTGEDRTRADPLTRLERLECKVAARNHTIKLRGSDCRLRRRSAPALAFMVNCA